MNLFVAIGNPLMKLILRSPLHGLASHNTMLITVTGRKSGKVYTTPVNYVRDGDILLVTSLRGRVWWKNLRGGAPVSVRLQGHDLKGIAEAVTDDEAVRKGLLAYLRKVPDYARYFQVSLDPDGQPNVEDVTRAAHNRVMIEIRLS
jgi:deazaflavin-dependent oxidoreductase (nitroreductase family)